MAHSTKNQKVPRWWIFHDYIGILHKQWSRHPCATILYLRRKDSDTKVLPINLIKTYNVEIVIALNWTEKPKIIFYHYIFPQSFKPSILKIKMAIFLMKPYLTNVLYWQSRKQKEKEEREKNLEEWLVKILSSGSKSSQKVDEN